MIGIFHSSECLEQLGSLIENYGVTVCHPSPSVALKEIARQISDRDNSVRNAALNCVVQAYFIEQDKVYKMIGQVIYIFTLSFCHYRQQFFHQYIFLLHYYFG